MRYVAVTRLTVRRPWLLPAFLVTTVRIGLQAWRAPGFRGGYLSADARGGFWTVTTWDSPHDMRTFITSGHHGRVAPKLAAWSSDAVYAGWQGESVPGFREASRRVLENPTRIELPHQSRRPTRGAGLLAATLPLLPRSARGSRAAV